MTVRSFTSSSEKRNGSDCWCRALVCGLLCTVIVLGAWEAFWRAWGFAPVIEDDLGIWAVVRRGVDRGGGGPAIVLLGASRMQLDVDPRVLRAETGRKAAMLAIDGSSPLPVLADLAGRSSFDGLIICSLLPQWLADGGEDRGRSARWVRKYHQQKWSFWIETRLSLFLQDSFVFRYRGLLPDRLWRNFLDGEMPRPPYAAMRSDRYRPADYSLTDIAKLRAARIDRQREIVAAAEPLDDAEFAARLAWIEDMVQLVRDRGGSVIFVRLPSCGETLELEEATWPREKYWDRFAATTSARTLHFADHPELSSFDCPDGSHLDHRDAVPFTRALVEVLVLARDVP